MKRSSKPPRRVRAGPASPVIRPRLALGWLPGRPTTSASAPARGSPCAAVAGESVPDAIRRIARSVAASRPTTEPPTSEPSGRPMRMESSRDGSTTWSAVRTRSAARAMPEADCPRRAWTRTVHAPAACTASASWFERLVSSDMLPLYGECLPPPPSRRVGGGLVSSGRRATLPADLEGGEDGLVARRWEADFGNRLVRGAADGLVEEAFGHHFRRVVQVATVDQERVLHRLADPIQVQPTEFTPRRDQNERVGTLGDGVRVRAQLDTRQQDRRGLVRGRVVRFDLCALGPEQVNDFDCGRFAQIVGIGLEGQTQDADGPVLDGAERAAHLLQHQPTHVAIDLHHGPQELRVRASHAGHVCEGLHVFREAGAAVADASFQELRTDASIEAHAARDFLHVGAEPLADTGDLVDKADLGCQERIRGVLDHFRGADVGLDDGRLGLQVAVEAGDAFDGLRLGAAQHDAVRMTEVIDGRAFAQELWIANHAEARAGPIARAFEGRQHPIAGADRHGALVDDDQAAFRRGVLAEAVRGRFDLGHVGLALDARRRANAHERELGGLQALDVVERKAQATSLDILNHDLFQPRLVNRQLAAPEPFHFARVNVDPYDLVAQLRETGGGYQPNVIGPDYSDVGHRNKFSPL